MDRLMLSLPEACEATGLNRTALYAEMAAGRLRGVKVGNRRFFPRDELVEYVDRLRSESARDGSPCVEQGSEEATK